MKKIIYIGNFSFPKNNAAMESIIGWMKEEIFNDFNIKDSDDPVKTVESYIKFFNEERNQLTH